MGPPESGVPDEASGQRQWSASWRFGWLPHVWIVVVDDAPTWEAELLRQSLPQQLYEGMSDSWDNDPAYLRPADERVILVPASRPEAGTTSSAHPEWAVGPRRRDDPAIAEARRSLGETLASWGTAEVEPLRALAAVEHWRSLLAGERVAESDEEQRFLVTLPTRYWASVLVVTTRDDESTIDRIGLARLGQGVDSTVQGGGEVCASGAVEEAVPRLIHGLPSPYFTCEEQISWGFSDGRALCIAPPAPLPDSGAGAGQVACRVWLTLDGNEFCDPAHGWLDPLNQVGERRPITVEEDGVKKQRCEVRQLEGTALASCRSDPDCTGCGAGWCLRESWTPEQVAARDDLGTETFLCPEPDTVAALRFRFTGGSDLRGELELVCDQ